MHHVRLPDDEAPSHYPVLPTITQTRGLPMFMEAYSTYHKMREERPGLSAGVSERCDELFKKPFAA